MFDRPAEIYVYDAAVGARELRTFHAARRAAAQPIRLSYYGGGHYDSIIGPGFDAPILRSAPGVAEAQFLTQVQHRRLGAFGRVR